MRPWGNGGVSVLQVLTCEQRMRWASPRSRLFRTLHLALVAAVSSAMMPLSYSLHSGGRHRAPSPRGPHRHLRHHHHRRLCLACTQRRARHAARPRDHYHRIAVVFITHVVLITTNLLLFFLIPIITATLLPSSWS